MTRKKTGGGKRRTRKLKIKKETLKALDATRGKNVKGGQVVSVDEFCTRNFPCETGNIFCENRLPVTYGGCPTLQCMPTLWACGALIK